MYYYVTDPAADDHQGGFPRKTYLFKAADQFPKETLAEITP